MPALQGKRVLIVDDTTENTRLFRVLLQLEGAEVLEADMAHAGIAIAQREQPDIILMDVNLPGIDGLEATRLLREDASTASIPVLAVTAAVMPHDLDEVEQSGCVGYIAKPIEPTSFAQQVAEYLEPAPSQV